MLGESPQGATEIDPHPAIGLTFDLGPKKVEVVRVIGEYGDGLLVNVYCEQDERFYGHQRLPFDALDACLFGVVGGGEVRR